MWKPDQLLAAPTVRSLRHGGFTETQIEFLGWLSGYAQALNNSKNPVKAGHTILSKEKTKKMLIVFIAKKKESVAPKEVPEHEDADILFSQLDKWQEHVERRVTESVPRKKTQNEDGVE